MTHFYVFNGDADGLCALQQLRLTEPGEASLVTGVKRDISLLARTPAGPGDRCTVLDISLDVNRSALSSLLGAGVAIRYFDHHHAGEPPDHEALELHLDLDPRTCTSLIVDRHLAGRERRWAIVGAFGDNLFAEAEALAAGLGLAAERTARLRELGLYLNYNAYGETIADLHVPPLELARQISGQPDPYEFARESPTFAVLRDGYHDDMAQARKLEATHRSAGALLFVLPEAPWARRASGVFANELLTQNPASAIAIVSPASAGYVVSVRVPASSSRAADAFCRRYETGGGRRTAAGINRLPRADLDAFAADFAEYFRSP